MEDRPPDVPPAYAPYGSAPPPPPAPPPARAPIPWEDPTRPKVGAFFDTVKLLYTRTREAYERMPLTHDVLKPYLFGILAGWIGATFGAVWQMMQSSMMAGMMQNLPDIPGADRAQIEHLAHLMNGPVTIAFAPVTVAIVILCTALITQLFLMMLGAAKSGFVATLRVVCYAQAATLLQIVPGCGSAVGAIVGVLFLIIGFSAAHCVSAGRAAAAVLLPAVLCCVCVGIGAAVFGAALLHTLHAMGH